LLTDASGFSLAVEAFEGNKAETATMLPVINAFKAAHQLCDVTVVADAGMISEANQVALQAAGLSFILGARIPFCPTWSGNGATNTPTRLFPISWC
jgi:transposase